MYIYIYIVFVVAAFNIQTILTLTDRLCSKCVSNIDSVGTGTLIRMLHSFAASKMNQTKMKTEHLQLFEHKVIDSTNNANSVNGLDADQWQGLIRACQHFNYLPSEELVAKVGRRHCARHSNLIENHIMYVCWVDCS